MGVNLARNLTTEGTEFHRGRPNFILNSVFLCVLRGFYFLFIRKLAHMVLVKELSVKTGRRSQKVNTVKKLDT